MANNVLGTELEPCSTEPLTGFYRDGCCNTGGEDAGVHTVCAVMTEDFLVFSASVGNDLSTPNPAYGFVGLKPGDRWCLCASRWVEAFEAGKAPQVVLASTHMATLEYATLSELKAHAAEPADQPADQPVDTKAEATADEPADQPADGPADSD